MILSFCRSSARRLAGDLRLFSTSAWRAQPPTPLAKDQVKKLIYKSSWSVRDLQQLPGEGDADAKITKKQLHHLLRLSALPLPSSAEEEVKMIETLESQLHFVRAIQTADTTGVEPLQAIRDETSRAKAEDEISLETMKEELGKEKQVGFARRIVKENVPVDTSYVQSGNPLELAPKKVGRYVVVNTKTS